MMTPEQWEDAARFVGVTITVAGDGWPVMHGDAVRFWKPDTDKADFFDLWVKLERWLMDDTNHDRGTYTKVCVPRWCFDDAKECGTDAEIMQAGLLLAAAIGKTMRDNT